MYDLFDFHYHGLCEVDDGASDIEMMKRMIDISYNEGVRAICFTPHFKPYHFDSQNNIDSYNKRIKTSFKLAEQYALTSYPSLRLILGNEILAHNDICDSLSSGNCQCIGNTSYSLIEFKPEATAFEIINIVSKMTRKGYKPVIAHIERYSAFYKNFSLLSELKENGALLQVNANSIMKYKFGKIARFIKKALTENLVDIVATDAHDDSFFAPYLKKSYEKVAQKYGDIYAKKIFHDNQSLILSNQK